MKRRFETDLPVLTKLILNARDMRVMQQNSIVEQVQLLAEKTNRKVYIFPIDQAFPKAQQIHVPVQNLDGVKKETLSVIKRLADDLAEGVE